jgi:hypothetical protein
VHGAIYDAVNAIAGTPYQPYLVAPRAGRHASTDAAVATAAYQVLLALFPNQETRLRAQYDDSLAAIPDGTGKRPGSAQYAHRTRPTPRSGGTTGTSPSGRSNASWPPASTWTSCRRRACSRWWTLAQADAAIVCFTEKATWSFWRPVTAVQLADTDGNPRPSATRPGCRC